MRAAVPTAVHQPVSDIHEVPSGILQRKCGCGQHTGGGSCPACKGNKGMGVEAEAQAAPGGSRDLGPGHPIEGQTRRFMETRFGRDFSAVRVHTDAAAQPSAESLNARAYTTGSDIVFGTGEYAPQSFEGRHLLAHELTHVLQQRGHPGQQSKSELSSPGDPAEREADSVADAVMFGTRPIPAVLASPGARLLRACGPTDIGTPAGCAEEPPTFVAGQKLVKFNFDCDTFAPTEEAGLATFAGTIAATGPVTVHGYASTDGKATYNQHLSCARALEAKSTLESNGVAAGRITVKRHGPTPGPVDDRRSATIEAPITPTPAPPPPTPLTVAFSTVDASSSPTGMPDRIPPRVDTIAAVAVLGFTPPMAPIRISVDGAGGGNGDLTIDGSATVDVSASATLRLRGTTQTSVGNAGNLRLAADQGGTRLATSNDFSVSAVPQNQTMAFSCLVGPGCASHAFPGSADVVGIKVSHTWESDSTNTGDLDQTDIAERVEDDGTGGSLSGIATVTSGYLGVGTISLVDEHSINHPPSASGFLLQKQTQMFKDLRSGAADIPMTNSGYRIGQFILPVPGGGAPGAFQLTVMKFGSTQTAVGVRSNAGTGSVSRTQNI